MGRPSSVRSHISKGLKQASMSLVKSKQRVADHGEEITSQWIVEAMLDLVLSAPMWLTKDWFNSLESFGLRPQLSHGG